MRLSEHFTLEELSFSEIAVRSGIDNCPGDEQISNLKRVADLMEAIRALLRSSPILVHSGYRSPAVNRSVGGVASSAHCLGLACDFTCPSIGEPNVVAEKIFESDIQYDQLILEYGWVHVSLSPEGGQPRCESLTKSSYRAIYQRGIRS